MKHMKSHGIGVMTVMQPKKEFKKEPEFIQDHGHGVFGDQTNHLLRMIAQKGPLTPEQISGPGSVAQALPTNGAVSTSEFLSKPEVARALSNPEVIAAFSNPDVVKAFALSPPKKGDSSPPPVGQAQAQGQNLAQGQAPPEGVSVSVGPPTSGTTSVPPELSKLPAGFSIFPVVAPSGGASTPTTGAATQGEPVTVQPVSSQSYYPASGTSYVATVPGHRGVGVGVAGVAATELTTIPMSWAAAGWPMPGQAAAMVNIRSPAKVEPEARDSQGTAKHWETAAVPYFRSPFT